MTLHKWNPLSPANAAISSELWRSVHVADANYCSMHPICFLRNKYIVGWILLLCEFSVDLKLEQYRTFFHQRTRYKYVFIFI